MIFLTYSEISELTGCRQKAAQRRWLDRNGIRYFIRADGRPAVTTDAITGTTVNTGGPRRATGPNLAALDQLN